LQTLSVRHIKILIIDRSNKYLQVDLFQTSDANEGGEEKNEELLF